jgi:hypothetical protein
MTWRDKYMRDPELADSIIKALREELKEAEKRAEMLQLALERIVNFDHWSTYKIREEAREALK